jgi:DNA-directed RNA polymerase specialized sigma24 family protein
MLPEGDGSVSRWLGDLKDGDLAAAQPLWERYFDRLVRLAGARSRTAQRRPSADADGEDAALSAFDSFCAGAVRGRFPQLADRDELWRLLVVITARKVQAQARRRRRRKRGGGLVRNESDLPEAGGGPGARDLDRIVGDEPTPAFAAQVAEECRRLLDALGDESLRLVALARMEGYTNDEIAERLGCARRTVARRLDLIRKTWLSSSP